MKRLTSTLLTVALTASCQGGDDATTATLHWAMVSAGDVHACALTLTGDAYCWGNFLVNGSDTLTHAPTLVQGGHQFVTISAGGNVTCALTASNDAYCWGVGDNGELGNGRFENSAVPVPVGVGLKLAQISAGGSYACGVAVGGAAYCWGANFAGEAGFGATTRSSTPINVAPATTFTSISASLSQTCGVTTAGAAYCWGNAFFPNDPVRRTPVAVAGGIVFATVVTGSKAACGLTPAGAAYCWGFGARNSLGRGADTTSTMIPAPVVGGNEFEAIGRDWATQRACGMLKSGPLYCWGTPREGGANSGTPAMVFSGWAFSSVSVGVYTDCGLVGADVYCWGNNTFGSLGTGNASSSAVPVRIAAP